MRGSDFHRHIDNVALRRGFVTIALSNPCLLAHKDGASMVARKSCDLVSARRCGLGHESGIGKRRLAARHEASATYLARRREIAEAAVRVFNKLGLERASMAAVAQELGIDRASLYYYVSSKDVLFDEVVRAVVERNLELVTAIADSEMSSCHKLRALLTGLMSSYGENYPLFYIYIRENLAHVSAKRQAWSQDMRELNRKTTDCVIAIVEQGYADGSLRNIGSARVVAYGILGVVGWTHRWFRPGQSEVGADEIGRMYAQMILAGLEPSPSALPPHQP